MNDWFILFLIIFACTAIRIYRVEMAVYRKLVNMRGRNEIINLIPRDTIDWAIAKQVEFMIRMVISGILTLISGVTLFCLFG